MTFDEAIQILKQTSPLKITISGDLGAGKSTYAKRLAEALAIPRTYAGALLREKAKEQGIDINELGRLMESEEELDKWVDNVTAERSREIDRGIFEGRLAWKFVENPTVNVFISVDPAIAAERIWGDKQNPLRTQYASIEEVKEKNQERKQSEITRYEKYYQTNIYDTSHYDIVFDASNDDADGVFEKVTIQIADFVRNSS